MKLRILCKYEYGEDDQPQTIYKTHVVEVPDDSPVLTRPFGIGGPMEVYGGEWLTPESPDA